MEYNAENFVSFIENGRRDKISPRGLELIAERFRELECEVNKLSLVAVSGSLPLSESIDCEKDGKFMDGITNSKQEPLKEFTKHVLEIKLVDVIIDRINDKFEQFKNKLKKQDS